jgi:Pvc16 N-terminal domain
MIHDVDESLRKVILRDALNGSGAELTFEAPTKDWAARRSAPTVDLYLYDIREDLARRDVAYDARRDDKGRVVDRRPPPRRFALSYLVTAWTKRPEDEHRLLAAVLTCFLRFSALPEEVLEGSLAEARAPILVSIALPPPDDRSISDLWSAVGGDLKASLDLVVTAPFDTGRVAPAGPPVVEHPRVVVAAARADEEPAPDKRTRRKPRRPVKVPAEAAAKPAAEDTVHAGTGGKPGRTLRVREIPRR